MSDAPVLEAVGLCVGFGRPRTETVLLSHIDLVLEAGDSCAILGPSGSGKTLTACALAGLLPPPLRMLSGVIRFQGKTLPPQTSRVWRRIRGRGMLMLFQSPALALHPQLSIQTQIADALIDVRGLRSAAARRQADELLEQVGMPAATGRMVPFQLSGGMQQRVLIALALALKPAVLIADEPGVGLNATHQRAVLQMLQQLNLNWGMVLLVITHDVRIASFLTTRAIVLTDGRLVEAGPVQHLLAGPRTPYTRDLVHCLNFLGSK